MAKSPNQQKPQKPQLRPSTKKARQPELPTRKIPFRRIAIILFVLGALLAAGCGVMFLVIDDNTSRRLAARGTSEEPALYSDVRVIQRGQKIRPALLRSELFRREYREIAGTAQHEGEYSVQQSIFDIKTRGFLGPDGTTVPSVHVHYRSDSGLMGFAGNDQGSSFSLEPQVISNLSSGDSRASRFVPLSQIPKTMQNAVISIEDERFYRHFGIDLIGTARALVTDLRLMSVAQGGSTITQQLAKNLFLSPKRTFGRKFMELFTALSLEHELSKSEILELYLNEVYLGQEGAVSIHGVAEAARTFFGTDLGHLSAGQFAMIAGMIKAPSVFSPRRHLDRALERRDIVLAQMKDQKYIDAKTYESARLERPTIIEPGAETKHAPHFTAAIRQIMSTENGLDAPTLSTLRVYTGLDFELQHCAEHAVTAGVQDLERKNKGLLRKNHKLEAGLVAIEPFSGKVRAWAGGRDFSENQFDHVYLASRQIGSTIKPFVYLTALDADLNRYKVATTLSVLADEPTTIHIPGSPDWTPENYERTYHGNVTLRYALEHSLNVPTVYLAQRVGFPVVAQTIEKFHVAKKVPVVPSIVLGTIETNLLDLTAAYAAIANGGIYVKPRPFMSALDREGESVASTSVSEERVAADGPVYVLTNILQGVIERGTATKVRSLGYTADAAGKTGTTDSERDAWFVGFTPDLAAGVWVGFDDNKRVGLTGGVAAVPIWTEFMKCAAQFREPLPFIPPASVSFVSIDAQSRMRATPQCPREDVVDEVFVKGTEPTAECTLHNGSEIAPRMQEEPSLDDDDRANPNPRDAASEKPRSTWESIFGR